MQSGVSDHRAAKKRKRFFRYFWVFLFAAPISALLQLVFTGDGYGWLVVCRAILDCWVIARDSTPATFSFSLLASGIARWMDAKWFGGPSLKESVHTLRTAIIAPASIGTSVLVVVVFLLHVWIISPAELRRETKQAYEEKLGQLLNQTTKSVQQMRIKYLEDLAKARENRTNILVAADKVQTAWQPPELPIGCKKVYVTFGDTLFEHNVEVLKTNGLWRIGITEPIRCHIESNRFYVDITVINPSRPDVPIIIKNGQIGATPPDSDRNDSVTDFEVVDELQKPILQLRYKQPEHVIINGIFPITSNYFNFVFKEGTIISVPNDNPGNIKLPERKAIFKYPGLRYHGQYADK